MPCAAQVGLFSAFGNVLSKTLPEPERCSHKWKNRQPEGNQSKLRLIVVANVATSRCPTSRNLTSVPFHRDRT
jgi:hypothetical protein